MANEKNESNFSQTNSPPRTVETASMPEGSSSFLPQPRNFMVSNNLVFWSLTIVWFIFVALYSFIFLDFLHSITSTINFLPKGTLEVSRRLDEIKSTFMLFSVFALVNGALIFLGLKWQKFARVFLKFVDPIIFLAGIAGILVARLTPCEGLSCIGNAVTMFSGIIALGSLLVHVPLFLLLLNKTSRKKISTITLIFIFFMILVPASTYLYAAKTLPKKAESYRSQARKDLGFTVFKPSYLPKKEGYKLDEGLNSNKDNEYYIDYVYYEENDSLEWSILIRETASKESDRILNRSGSKQIVINGNPALLSSSIVGSTYTINIEWDIEVTTIKMTYYVNVPKKSLEEEGAEAIKIAESMSPLNPEKLGQSSKSRDPFGFTVFKPSYLPQEEIYDSGEQKQGNDYFLWYVYKREIEGSKGELKITERSSGGIKKNYDTYYGPHWSKEELTINGSPAVVYSAEGVQRNSMFFTVIVWTEDGTEITLWYGNFGTQESIDAEAMKIAESMEPQN